MDRYRWTVTVEEDPETGDVILPLPQELLAKQGWEDGTLLEWVQQPDGTYIIQKAKDGER
jgi:hypothetical protein